MLLRRITDFVLHSRIQAMGLAFVTAFLPVIGSVSVLIAALVTLRKGAIDGLLVACAATIPILISAATTYSAGNLNVVTLVIIGILALSNLLTWMLAVLLRQHANWSLVIEVAALLGIVIIAIVHFMYPDVQAWWETQLLAYYNKIGSFVGQAMSGVEPTVSTAEIEPEVILHAKQHATGLVVASVMFNVIVQLLVARWWQAAIFNPGGLRKELYQIRLSHAFAAIFILGFALSYLGSVISTDMMPVLYAAFCAAGLSLAHYILSKVKYGLAWLILIYVGLAIYLFAPVMIVTLSLIALLDSILDFRKRLQKFFE